MVGPPPVGHKKPAIKGADQPPDSTNVPPHSDGGAGVPVPPPSPDLIGLPTGWNVQPFRTGFPLEIVSGERRTTLRTVPFTDTQLVPKLTELLGKGFRDAIRNKTEFEASHTVETSYGPLTVRVIYKPHQHNEIYFHLSDTQTTGTSLWLVLDKNGSPTQFTSIDDPNNIFSGVFADLKMPSASQALGVVDQQTYQKRIETINNYDTVTREIREAQGDLTRRITVRKDYSGPDTGIFVQRNEFYVASMGVPLATAGVNTCSALIVIDRAGKRHYLAHIDSGSTAEQIANSVRTNFGTLGRLEVYVMEGLMPSGTVQNIYTALKSMGLEKKVKFISFSGSDFPQVGTQNGELFNPTITFRQKSVERITR